MAGKKGRSGGARPGAGRKPPKPKKSKAKALQTKDPDEFLKAVMSDPNMDFKDRMVAALALKKEGKLGPLGGKREQQQAAANGVARSNSLSPLPAPTKARAHLRAVK